VAGALREKRREGATGRTSFRQGTGELMRGEKLQARGASGDESSKEGN